MAVYFLNGGHDLENYGKLLVFLCCLPIVFPVRPSVGSTPLKQEMPQEAWVYYATDEDGADYAYNPVNMERLEGNLVRVWVKALYPEKNGKDGTSSTIETPSDWSPIPAESTAETLFEMTCKQQGRKK